MDKVDLKILEIIGNESPLINGLDIPESSGEGSSVGVSNKPSAAQLPDNTPSTENRKRRAHFTNSQGSTNAMGKRLHKDHDPNSLAQEKDAIDKN